MNNEQNNPILCPHGWRKFEQAQRNFLRYARRRGQRNYRRARKWAFAMDKWINRIYNTNCTIYEQR